MVTMNEPDRPRRDVSIEEAERMPMTDEELDAIEADSKTDPMRHQARMILALVAEVRRLRAENRHLKFNQRWMHKSLGLGLPPDMKP